MTSQQTIAMHILLNISPIKENPVIELGQLIECIKRNTVLPK